MLLNRRSSFRLFSQILPIPVYLARFGNVHPVIVAKIFSTFHVGTYWAVIFLLGRVFALWLLWKKQKNISKIFVFQCEFEKIKPPRQAGKYRKNFQTTKLIGQKKKKKQDPSLVWDSCDDFWRFVFGNIGEL